MTNSFYSLERTIASTSLVSSTVNYVSYWRFIYFFRGFSHFSFFSYLMMQFSPRISYEEKYTDAYTPESLKYNAYIVYGMIFSYLLYLVNDNWI